MQLLQILQNGSEHLPPGFRAAFKQAVLHIDQMAGERDILTLTINGVVLQFNVYYSHQIGNLQLNYIQRDASHAQAGNSLPTLVMSPVIYSRVGEKLMEMNINFMDSVGNVYINAKTVYIQNTQRKREIARKIGKSRLFGDAGLKLLFVLLQNPNAVNFPYRELAKLTGISPASITILYREMAQNGFLLENIDGTKRLLRKTELLQRWVNGYQEKLRPKLLVGHYKSVDRDLVRNYRDRPIWTWRGSWGGEAAAAIYTDYLRPKELIMYIPEEEGQWRKELKVIPSEKEADIAVFRYFWNPDHHLFQTVPNLAPPILVYAELASSSDSRNQETAQKIYDEYLQFIEQ